ncbi:hypothetical protein V6N11_055486 [Hibiscus sabdariffa]|uniref:Uncharacterized protein n=1 Tax=Hibiscus sabdariffa TaxID=183260 RepID=A0ABR2PFH9_9ROSI
MSSSTNVGTSDRVDLPIDCDTENLVGRWCETLDDFSEDEENIVPITEVDDVRLLDVDDVEIVRTVATTGNGMDVEDDVWDAAVARLGLVNDKHVWGYVEPEHNQSEHNYPAYEPPAHITPTNAQLTQGGQLSKHCRESLRQVGPACMHSHCIDVKHAWSMQSQLKGFYRCRIAGNQS